MRFRVLALVGWVAACTAERAAAPDAAPPATPPAEMRLLGHRALRDEGGTLVPVFDAESLPVVRVEGTAPALELGVPAQVDAEVRGKWTFLRVRGPAPDPGAGELRAVLDGRVLRTWPVRWAVAPEKLPALAPVAELRRAGKPKEALERLEAALPSMGPEARHWGLAERARLLWALDAGERATAAWVEAAEAARAAGVPSEETRCLRAAAYTAFFRRRFADARGHLARAEPVEARLDDPRGRARQHYYSAMLAQELGDYREASERLTAALRLAEESAADTDRVGFAEMLAHLEQDLGRHAEALRLMDELERQNAAKATDPATHARFSINRCWIELRAMSEGALPADWTGVRRRLEQVVAEARAAGDRVVEAEAVVNLAEVSLRAGDADGARRWLQAFAGLNARADRYARLFALRVTGELHLRDGRPADARREFEALLALTRREVHDGTSDAAWRAWFGIGRARLAEGHPDAALESFRRALGLLDTVGRGTDVRGSRAPFFADRRQLVEETISLLLARRDLPGAFAVADASLSRAVRAVERPLMTARLNEAQAARWSDLSATYLARRDAWEALGREADLAAGSARVGLESRAEAAREAAARAFDEALRFLESAVPEGAGAADAADVLEALGPREALVELARLGDRTIAFWVQGGHVEQAPVDPRDPLAPWAARLDGLEHLYVVDAGLAEAATFDRSSAPGALPLVVRVPTSHLPYAGLLLRPAATADGPPLVVADPGLDLPHARREGEEVASHLADARTLAGGEATRARVLARLGRSRVFHFAGHGVLDPGQPWDAHLRLAADERLTLADILVARPPLGLVVLSGCETGRAAALSRVESLGLPAAFLVAGARSVLAANREIPDDQAQRFVRRFYRAGGAATPGIAFRQAVAETRAAGEPVWDAFRLFGRP